MKLFNKKGGKVGLVKKDEVTTEEEAAPIEPHAESSEVPGTAPEDPIEVEPPDVIVDPEEEPIVPSEPEEAPVEPQLDEIEPEVIEVTKDLVDEPIEPQGEPALPPEKTYRVFYTEVRKDMVAEITGTEELANVLDELDVAKSAGLVEPDVRVELGD